MSFGLCGSGVTVRDRNYLSRSANFVDSFLLLREFWWISLLAILFCEILGFRL